MIVESRFEVRHGHLFLFQFASEFCVFTFEPGVAAEVINGTMFGCSHQPGARIIRNARLRPLLDRRHQSVLREILGNPDVPHNSHQASDQARRLDSPDRVNRAMDSRGVLVAMWIGSRHSYRSHHLCSIRATGLRVPTYLQGKSFGPNICRTSVSPSHPGQCFLCNSMKRTAPCTASSLEANSNCAKPPMTSLASVNGPSVTVTCPPERRTRAPCAVGVSPPLPSMVPACTASAESFAIASINGCGRNPCPSLCLTIIMNFMVVSPLSSVMSSVLDGAGRPDVGSIYTSNEDRENRQAKNFSQAASTVSSRLFSRSSVLYAF